ncbi:plasmid mobilization relaxosome protein MobC [Alcaligenes faecalis]|jgi:hypothetical protein|uniref:plasmid mobilization relaxosome protein MobC n=1 Tax=Alcaligenes faecalis TaxID=511 RepID=UPI0034D71B71
MIKDEDKKKKFRNFPLEKHIRITEETDLKLKQLKKELGLNYSEIIEILINGGMPYTKVFFSIQHELKKQGVNLNQITKHINTTKIIDNDVCNEIKNIKSKINELIHLLKEQNKHN